MTTSHQRSWPALALPARQPAPARRCATWLGALFLAPIWFVAVGCTHEVTRIADGTTRHERAISARAYAAFARGRLQELQGDPAAALLSYHEVLKLDGSAEEAWTRIGAIRCAKDYTASEQAFHQAEQLNPQSGPVFFAKARCALLHGRTDVAAVAARQALRFSPNSPEISLLQIQVQIARGVQRDALRYAWAHVALYPNDSAGWLILSRLTDSPVGAKEHLEPGVRARMPRAMPPTASIELVLPNRRRTPPASHRRSRISLEQAMARHDARAAQRSARELHMGILDLLSAAMELDAIDLAASQANLAGQIQPEDPNLWQLRLMFADLAGDDEQFSLLLQQTPKGSASPSPPVDWTPLLEVIERRTGAIFGEQQSGEAVSNSNRR